MELQQHLEKLRACQEAREWAGERTPQQAWDECERADWLLWWSAATGADRKEVVLAACACAMQRGVRAAYAGGRDAAGRKGGDCIAELPGAVTRGVVTCPACGVRDGGHSWVPPALFGEELTGYKHEGGYKCSTCGETSDSADWEANSRVAQASAKMERPESKK